MEKIAMISDFTERAEALEAAGCRSSALDEKQRFCFAWKAAIGTALCSPA